MIKLGANILSQRVQRNLGRSTADLSKASERLSSGQRINGASDDAAGLAIAMSLRADSRIFGQSIRNLNDGISLASIAESALGSLSGITERIQELATQSMSSTFGDKQRESMQREVSALQSEWNRIIEATTFNGTNLLTGSNTRTVLQGGKTAEGTLALEIGEEQFGEIVTVSRGMSGESNGTSSVTGISADGRYVSYLSLATNLVAGDTNGVYDAFVYDSIEQRSQRISTNSAGQEGNAGSTWTGISNDGRIAVFESDATNLIGGDSNLSTDVFMKNIVTGQTTLLSASSQGVQGNGLSQVRAMTPDGKYVAILSDSSNLESGDTNGTYDVFIKNTVTGAMRLASSDANGNFGNGTSLVNAISADGRYVAFRSDATNFVASDADTIVDAYLKDMSSGAISLVSQVSTNGVKGNGQSTVRGISADGRYVLFHSVATNLYGNDTNTSTDVFLKDTVSGDLALVSSGYDGSVANGHSYAQSVSADGRFVVFSSDASNIVAADGNSARDVFVKDMFLGTIKRVGNARSGIEGDSGTDGGLISADGRMLAISSFATNLGPVHTNGQQDGFLVDLAELGVQKMAGMVVSNAVSAGVTLDLVSKYRDELIAYRSKIGASISRISTFINTVTSANINYKAAESRISDADIASEAATSVRNTILQQAASSLLGQANLEPRIALSLLQN